MIHQSMVTSWTKLLLPVVMLASGLLLAGCHTHHAKTAPAPEPPHGYLNTMPGNVPAPGTPHSRLETVIGEVLAAHGFPPAKSIPTADGIVQTSPRPKSEREVCLASIKCLPSGQTEVELTGYARISSDWAMLGQLFQEPLTREALEMEKQIQEKMHHP
jgi:hypothetical protein